MKIDNDEIQKKLEQEQQADTKTLSDGLLAALSLAVIELYRKYGPELNINRGSRKKTFFATVSDIVTDHYKRVRQLVDSKARAGFATAHGLFMDAYEKALDLPLIKSLPEKVVEEARKQMRPLRSTISYNRRLTLKQLSKKLMQSFRRKDTADQTISEVDKVVKSDKERVEMVIENEVATMQERGKLQSFDDADSQGLAPSYTWQTYRDKKVRDKHRELRGKTPDKDGWFRIGGAKAKSPKTFGVPSLDINCRCYLTITGVDLKDNKAWIELNSAASSSERRERWLEIRALARERAKGDIS